MCPSPQSRQFAPPSQADPMIDEEAGAARCGPVHERASRRLRLAWQADATGFAAFERSSSIDPRNPLIIDPFQFASHLAGLSARVAK